MDDPTQEGLEQRAERSVRRGELLVALDSFERLLALRPDDERLRGRIESVRSLLQPSELVHRRRAESPPEPAVEAALNDAEQGELYASNGRYALALQCYRRAVEAHSKNELLRERLAELFKLAPPDSRAVDDGLARAEKLEALTTPAGAQSVRSSRATEATFRPEPATIPPASATAQAPELARASAPTRPPAPKAAGSAPPRASLPRDPIEMLRALLSRVAKNRR